MTTLSFLANLSQSCQEHLEKQGYSTVFDVIQHGKADFLSQVPDIDSQEADLVYHEALQRAETLKSLFRAWQLRHEPVIAGLPKLAASSAASLQTMLERNIADESDFSDLMARSSVYADAASIQSLFSPGRYITALYRVAQTLHAPTSDQHIDKRRPDLQNLVLSEANLSQEVTALDILLDVLQEGSNTLDRLSTAYFPMTLPYDDSLTMADAALTAQGRTLNGVWQTLAAQPGVNTTIDIDPIPSAMVRTTLNLPPVSYALMQQPEANLKQQDIGKHYGLSTTQYNSPAELATTLNDIDTFCQKTDLTFNELHELTAGAKASVISFRYFGYYDKLFFQADLDILAGTMTVNVESGMPHSGYQSPYASFVFTQNGSNVPTYSFVAKGNETQTQQTLRFRDIGPGATIEVWHQERSRLKIIDAATQKPIFSPQNATTHKFVVTPSGLKDAQANSVCTYNHSTLFHQFGTPADVSAYGAAWLNDVTDSGSELTLIMPDSPSLNFTPDSVCALAGRAEKLIRLRQKTGLSFTELDWILQNAPISPVGLTDTLKLQQQLDGLAACLALQHRYGIDTDTAVSFTGPLNPYARVGEISSLERLFTRLVIEKVTVNYQGRNSSAEAACCNALGVTLDELSRIGRYCFGSVGNFTLTPETAGRIYRFSAIPRMLGMTFAEAECLWQLMANEEDTLLMQLGVPSCNFAHELIRRTEQTLVWMTENELTLISLQAMVTTCYSDDATAEMYTFLHNIYQSALKGPTESDNLHRGLLLVMSGGFGIKTNIMDALIRWLEVMTQDDGTKRFTLQTYLDAINNLFAQQPPPALDDLQKQTTLVYHTQQLSQLVLIARRLNLNEQTVFTLVNTPALLDPKFTKPKLKLKPTLPLMMVLSHFQRWQTRVVVPRDEALLLLPWLANTKGKDALQAAEKIAAVHNVNAEAVRETFIPLHGAKDWPTNFVQLWQLLQWLQTGETLNVGAATLKDLWDMRKMSAEKVDSALFSRVAHDLSAGLRP